MNLQSKLIYLAVILVFLGTTSIGSNNILASPLKFTQNGLDNIYSNANIGSSIVIGGFDSSRGGSGGSIQYGSYFEQARTSISSNFPTVSLTSFTTISSTSLSGVNILILTSLNTNVTAISPLSSDEKTALNEFSNRGGCTIIMTDNNIFDSSKSILANESLIDPFGMYVDGNYSQRTIATITDPTSSLITNGPFGQVSSFSQFWPGGITELGPYANQLASNVLGGALAIINRNVLHAGSGPVIIFSDGNSFFDTSDYGYFSENENIFLNTIHFCNSVPCPQSQWNGEYFRNRDLQGAPIYRSCANSIDFYWGKGSPDVSIPIDNFSVRWSRTVDFPKTGWYRFRTFSDDGVRLYIDGNIVIDDWVARTFDEKSFGQNITSGNHLIMMEYVEWSNDAMAHLDWYLCPNGASDCSMNITPLYQTSNQYLNLPMPSDCTNVNDQTFAKYGCFVTSISMALQKVGVNTTPTELNQWLTDHNAYSGGNCTANLSSLKYDLIKEFAQQTKYGKNITWKWANNVTKIIRDDKLPVIMHFGTSGNGHFILAVDLAEEIDGVQTYGINDPYHSLRCNVISVDPNNPKSPPNTILDCKGQGSLKHFITQREAEAFRGIASPIIYLAPNSDVQTQSIQINVKGGEILLEDNLGRRVGYDSASQIVLQEIPNGMYFDSTINPVGSVSSATLLMRTLYITNDAPTLFKVIVTSMVHLPNLLSANSPIELEIIGNDATYNTTTVTVEADPAATYLINFTPGNGFEVKESYGVYLPIIKR